LKNNKIGLDDNLMSIDVLGIDGNIVSSTDTNRIGEDMSGKDYFTKAKDDIYVDDIHEIDNQVILAVSAPLYSRIHEDEFVGVIVGHYSASALNSLMIGEAVRNLGAQTQLRGIGETGETYIVNEDKLMITDSLFIENATLNQKVDTVPVNGCFDNNEELNGEWPDYRGVPVMGASMCITVGDFRWMLVSEQDVDEAVAPVKSLRNGIILTSFMLLIVILLLALFISRSISDPIKKMAQKLLGNSINLFTSASQSLTLAEQNALITAQVALSSSKQSKQTEEISESMNQMTTSVEEMSKSAKDVSEIALETSKKAQLAGQAGEQSQKTLSQIKDTVLNTAGMVSTMSQRSKTIGDIVGTITSIASQTNLLALNAAIEAARAGEAGRGFAVVADEVRKLAEESSEAANQVKEQIKGMIEQIDDTVIATQGGVKTADEGYKIIEKTLSGLQSATSSVQKVASKMEELSAGIQEQAISIQKISGSIDDISTVAEQNASGAQELSASSKEQSDITRDVNKAAEELRSLSFELQKVAGSKEDRILPEGERKTPNSKKLGEGKN